MPAGVNTKTNGGTNDLPLLYISKFFRKMCFRFRKNQHICHPPDRYQPNLYASLSYIRRYCDYPKLEISAHVYAICRSITVSIITVSGYSPAEIDEH